MLGVQPQCDLIALPKACSVRQAIWRWLALLLMGRPQRSIHKGPAGLPALVPGAAINCMAGR
jgi:hypothetical protein